MRAAGIDVPPVTSFVGQYAVADFLKLYCCRAQDADGNFRPGMMRVPSKFLPSRVLPYGKNANGDILKNMWGSEPFSQDLL